MHRSLTGGFLAFVLVSPSCANEQSPPAVQATSSASPAAVQPAAEKREGTVVHLAGRLGAPEELWIEASYKVKSEGGKLSKTLAVEIEQAPPGVAHALSLDGVELAKLTTNAKGKGEYELEDRFPAGFKDPAEGSVLEIGELAEIRLHVVKRETDLQADIAGQGSLTGKVSYKVERFGDAVTTEFQVKVSGAGSRAIHPVRIDGAHVGDLTVETGGKAKLEYTTPSDDPIPTGFKAPRAGSVVEIGQLWKGELRDNLVASE